MSRIFILLILSWYQQDKHRAMQRPKSRGSRTVSIQRNLGDATRFEPFMLLGEQSTFMN